ncbi:helix-turn-helix transcriptional regulator [Mucilaginibacter sp. L3T2-6]|uniref:helix-turn-helix transcriptional regulator n=1 Tax=Mucilaginibacter sp. L3T2-6 TaxID=3062491 RepID=UPI002676D136|nr:helix-turn-helix transcriptional regulator [Mucilaginibacter sp. L3T2-6]MDO3644901.1 helix-turn-helix transcriptional regulator [Mucilaginibacter sp. L3T2-6]MDV6217352.1 helix-turn-helix transcriptional regulator [Mucilaginibacter sp. L3T2-6]
MKNIPVRQLILPPQVQPTGGRFKIRRVEDIMGQTDLLHNLHRHSFFFILAIQQGHGRHEIDFTAYEVSDNTVFFLRPGQVHQLELKTGSTGYLVEFDHEYYPPDQKSSGQYLRKASYKNYCLLESSRFGKIYNALTYIFNEYTARELGYNEIIRANLDIFCIEYIRQSNSPALAITAARTYEQERFEEFLELLQKYITTHKQVADYLEFMHLSAYQLNEITKSSIGKTASELINEQVILEAKRYLLATSNQVKDIAEQLGYEDVSYFIRFFKKHTQYSPEAFRHRSG